MMASCNLFWIFHKMKISTLFKPFLGLLRSLKHLLHLSILKLGLKLPSIAKFIYRHQILHCVTASAPNHMILVWYLYGLLCMTFTSCNTCQNSATICKVNTRQKNGPISALLHKGQCFFATPNAFKYIDIRAKYNGSLIMFVWPISANGCTTSAKTALKTHTICFNEIFSHFRGSFEPK